MVCRWSIEDELTPSLNNSSTNREDAGGCLEIAVVEGDIIRLGITCDLVHRGI
jgi:hypothetical protein